MLQEENKEKDYSIGLFLREMNELLQAHEKNSKYRFNYLVDIINIEMEPEENKIPINNKVNLNIKQHLKSNTVNQSLNPSVLNSVRNINMTNQINQSAVSTSRPVYLSNPVTNSTSLLSGNTSSKLALGLSLGKGNISISNILSNKKK